MTAWVWICGSSAREVVWRNVAIVNPFVSGCSRPPFERMRVVDPNRSRCASAAVTAMSCASRSRWSPVSAHHTDNDFGAENVASNPDTARTTPTVASCTGPTAPGRAASPITGSRPDSNASNCSTVDLDPTGRARPPGGPTTHPEPRPAPPSGTRRSTSPSPPPTTHGGSSPAASTRPALPPTRWALVCSDLDDSIEGLGDLDTGGSLRTAAADGAAHRSGDGRRDGCALGH